MILACTVALCGGCSTAGDGAADDEALPEPAVATPASDGVRAIVTVDPPTVSPGGEIAVTLAVANATPDSVTLEYTSGQRYDIWVVRADGETVWNWAMDKLFAQMLGQEAIAPGDTLEFRDVAPAPAEPGEYRVIAAVTSSNRELADTADVTVRR